MRIFFTFRANLAFSSYFKFKYLLFICVFFLTVSCKRGPVLLKGHFENSEIPPEVDYTKSQSWAALPTAIDFADSLPKIPNISDAQNTAKADVFFIHPTIYTYEPTNNFIWNADVNDTYLNKKTDESTILNQATAFNGSCRVFAPRYRQAHYYSFITTDKSDAEKALNLAYSDVKKAFEHYLKYENNDRPIIIASHSQGTVHAKRLLKEYFDGTQLQNKLVMAYIIGIEVNPSIFTNLKPSQNPTETGCYAAWNTYSAGFFPKNYTAKLQSSVCTNPLTWSSANDYAHYSKNLGGIGTKFKFYPNITDAKNFNGLLWINRPKVPGAFLVRKKVWHVADINFFWMNIRENVETRINNYLAIKNKNESK